MVKVRNHNAMGGCIGVTFWGNNIFILGLKIFNAIDKAAGNCWRITEFNFDTSYRCNAAYQHQVAFGAGLRAVEIHVK